MKINFIQSPNFQRKLTPKEEVEYCAIIREAKAKSGNKGKTILIIPSSSFPQTAKNNTGVGNIGNEDGLKFVDFVKKYWDINGIQLLPTGQLHEHNGEIPLYSSTSMDLGNHMVDLKNKISPEDYDYIVNSNNISNRVNFQNIIKQNSSQNKMIEKAYKNRNYIEDMFFKKFKQENYEILHKKALFYALKKIHGHNKYYKWPKIDRYLFDDRVIDNSTRNRRIREIERIAEKDIEIYQYTKFLTEGYLKSTRHSLHKQGIKLYGDMPCGFSYDEVWAFPKAFLKDSTIGWNLPALDINSSEAERILREKVKFYAKNFDGIRVDASWTYVSPRITNTSNGEITKKYYGDKLLNVIDEQFKQVKGKNFESHNIMHEFTAASEDFNIYYDGELLPFVKDRVKIYTSQNLSEDWGTNRAFLKRGWDKDSFILGATNHDSRRIKYNEKQSNILAKIFKIKPKKMQKNNEFLKSKLAEPMSAYNSMIFFMDALGLKGKFQHNSDRSINYAIKVPENYEDAYFNALERGEAYNPMDAYAKIFKAKGLDKTEPKLYKQIVKYKKILESPAKNKTTLPLKIIALVGIMGTITAATYALRFSKNGD